jgi:protoporphyrinogen oxidase
VSATGSGQGRGKRIAVVGGGLGGLVAADRLLSQGHRVVLFEKYSGAGGLVGTDQVEGVPLERFYHHLFTSDVDYVSLAEDLGLSRDILWLKSRMGMYAHGGLHDFGTVSSLLRFSPLSLKGRLDFAVSTLRLRRITDWKGLEAETAAGWLKRNGYDEVYEKVWGPLLFQKYGARAEEIGLVWLWGKIALRTRSRNRSGLGERLGYMKGSFGRVVAALLARITKAGGELRMARPVRMMVKEDGRWRVEFGGGEESFDLVLSTVAIPELLRITPGLSDDRRERLRRIVYCHALCPMLELDRSLTPFYWLNIADREMPFGGVIEQTNFLPADTYGGRRVVYLSDYVLPEDPKWRMKDEELWALYLPALVRVSPGFDPSWILAKRINRGEYAQPVVGAHYSRVAPSLQSETPGLYVASMAQIYPEDRGQNYAVKLARLAAEQIQEDLR